ncbi:hypothetical protein HKD37_10G027464 [Glycine soja]
MATPPNSPPPPPPTSTTLHLSSTLKRTRKATRLRSLETRPVGAEKPPVHVDPATGKADGPHRKKLRTYLGIITRDKVDVTYEIWKQAEFDILKASNVRTKKKILQTSTRAVSTTLCVKSTTLARRSEPNFVRPAKTLRGRMCERRHRPSRNKTLPLTYCLKKKLEEAAQSRSTDTVIDSSSPIRRHVKWKMARMKKIGQMTSEAAKEITEKIDSFEEEASQGSFVAHGRQDVLTVAIGRPEHPGRMGAAGVGCHNDQIILWTGSKEFPYVYLHGPRKPRAADATNQGPAGGVDHRKSNSTANFQSQIQSQGLALPPEPEVGPLAARVSINESYVDSSGNDRHTGDSNKCGLYIKDNPPCLVSLGRLYEGSTTVHNIHLLHDQIKVGVEGVRDADALIPVPTKEGVVGPVKPADRPDHDVDDPLYLMTLTIPQLFLKSLQVMWDATMFGVFNENFPLYIKHEDLSEIAHDGQCLSISVIQLWILSSRDLDNRNLNQKVTSRTECRIQSGMCT